MENTDIGRSILYPDRDAKQPFRTLGFQLMDRMGIRGTDVVIEGARHRLRDEPLGIRLRELRAIFDGALGPASRMGEAFEDGALIGSLAFIDSDNARLESLVVEKIDAYLQRCEDSYYALPAATQMKFSDEPKNYVPYLRADGRAGYKEFHDHLRPVAVKVVLDRYENDPDIVSTVGQGIGFVLGRFKEAYQEDYASFAGTVAEADKSLVTRVGLFEEMAARALKHAHSAAPDNTQA